MRLIESRNEHPRSSQPLPNDEEAPIDLEALGDLVVDPERPMGADAFVKSLMSARVRRPTVRLLISTVGMLIPVLLVLWVWNSLPDDITSAERLSAILESVRGDRLSFAYVTFGYALLSLCFVPITALIAATALVFSPGTALLYSLSGSLTSAALAYLLGRLVGSRALRFLDGPRLRTLREGLHSHAFRATVVARLLPVGNFTVINLFAGALKIPFPAFLAGNLAGLSFGILGLTLLADQLSDAWHDPTFAKLGLLGVYILALFGVSLALSKLFERRAESKT